MTHLKVAVRIRPLSHREIENRNTSILTVEEGKTISITNLKVPEQNTGDSRERTRRFTFDFCFHENSTQDDVFYAVETIVEKAIKQRYHTCVLAYGQSSSGKTHTMMGFPHDPGLTPRLCQRVFNYLQETAVGDETSMKTTVSYLEIYNEKVRDLLQISDKYVVSSGTSSLRVRQHPKKGPYVQGLTEHPVTEPEALLHLLGIGNNNRRVASTLTNPQSSRSHSVFIVNCGAVKLTLVDLAGSERAGTRCYSASRFREGANINKSLVALGNVISALAEQSCKFSKGIRRIRFIPYRDSILTWLLKDTLGGNSNTVMIATISPSSACYSETVNTLRFGQRAKLIVSTPVVNEDPREKIIRELKEEIFRLKELLILNQIPQMATVPVEEITGNSSKDSQPSCNNNTTTDRLIPLMISSATITKEINPTPRLRRTFSVDHSMSANNPSSLPLHFGSQERIGLNKFKKMKKTEVVKKIEKGTATEKTFGNIAPKVDSIRKTPVNIKPRSQIVAAVTHRLYAKTKKKEVGTDTSDINTIDTRPKELTICSNARLRLKELTKKVMKAQKYKNIETQTDLFPVLRVKEVATDVDDLKLDLQEVRDVEVSSVVATEDKSINCQFIDDSKYFIVTNSCGTQVSSEEFTPKEQHSSSMSFTKYLCDPRPIFNPHTANPIYANSVNINISHNYGIKKQEGGDEVVSDDSLEQNRDPVCFPTPDLISNHNSLEPSHNHATNPSEEIKIKLSNNLIVHEQIENETIESFTIEPLQFCKANGKYFPNHSEQYQLIIPELFATEIRNIDTSEHCELFETNRPEMVKLKIVETPFYNDDCIKLSEPLVLKSIMKHFDSKSTSDEYSENELPDSLQYHLSNQNKKVRFTKNRNSQRMLKAMSGFLEEATVLMNNLTTVVTKIDNQRFPEDYDIEVTVNGVTGLQQKNRRKRKIKHRDVNCQTDSTCLQNDFTQTDCCNYCELPVNKYEIILEESCRKLEETINHSLISSTQTFDYSDGYHSFTYNPWDLSGDNEDSMESNPVTFSDYGSLPRRNLRKHRSSCSPSAYLKQLTNLRRQVIESSKEELYNHSH